MIVSAMKTGVLTVAVASVFGFAAPAQAQSYEHIDRLARKIERKAHDLHKEVDAHARRTPQYDHLHRDVGEIEKLAAHIHEVAHKEGDMRHIRDDAKKLDRLVHHAEEVLDELARSRRIGREAYGHIREEFDALARDVHHLRDDLK
jgi:chemotaxis protein histidine kinase CheA